MRKPGEARRFAKALYEAALKRGVLDAVRKDLLELGALIGTSGEFARFVSTEALGSREARTAALGKLFEGKVQPVTLEFLEVLEEAKVLHLLPEVGDQFERLVRDARGVVQVRVCSARPLDAGQVGMLRQRLAGRFGANVELALTEDPSLLGGFMYEADDRIYDYSVAGRLQRLRQRLLEVGP